MRLSEMKQSEEVHSGRPGSAEKIVENISVTGSD